jgi:hypothetical protein
MSCNDHHGILIFHTLSIAEAYYPFMVGPILVSPGKLGPIMAYGDGEGIGTMLYAASLPSLTTPGLIQSHYHAAYCTQPRDMVLQL